MFWIVLGTVAVAVVLGKLAAEVFWLSLLKSALLQLAFWLAAGLGLVALWRRVTRRWRQPNAAAAN